MRRYTCFSAVQPRCPLLAVVDVAGGERGDGMGSAALVRSVPAARRTGPKRRGGRNAPAVRILAGYPATAPSDAYRRRDSPAFPACGPLTSGPGACTSLLSLHTCTRPPTTVAVGLTVVQRDGSPRQS